MKSDGIETAKAKEVPPYQAIATLLTQTEAQLKESQDKYLSIFEKMNEGFILVEVVNDDQGRPIDYRFLDVNSASEKFFGRPRSEIVGYTYRTIGGKNADPDWITALNRVALTVEPLSLESYAPVGGQWVSLNAYSPRAGQFAAIFTNVTERKKDEETLKTSEEKFRAISETSLIQMSVTRTTDGIVLYANSAFCEKFGYKPDDLIGRTADVYVDAVDKATLIKKLNEQGSVEDYEVLVKRVDGSPFWVSTESQTSKGKPDSRKISRF
jgi:PAS domain S-box-containing protein